MKSPDDSTRYVEKVSLAQQRADDGIGIDFPSPCQDAPFAMLGAPREEHWPQAGKFEAIHSFFGPRALAICANGSLWVSDTGNHRILGWRQYPAGDQVWADFIVDGECHGKMNMPVGVSAVMENGLAICDSWNHRVLVWLKQPEDDRTPCDLILGQTNSNNTSVNGGGEVTAGSLNFPSAVLMVDGKLIVADTGNRRVLIWNDIPSKNGQFADCVLGQKSFSCRDENCGSEPSEMSMRWPHAITWFDGKLCVADPGNNRIMIWTGIPTGLGAPCSIVLGQDNFVSTYQNGPKNSVSSVVLNMPYGIASNSEWLFVADTANSRILAWHKNGLFTGAPATALLGQENASSRGDNRWRPAVYDSFCWPYGVSLWNDKLAIADTGNNRISVWKVTLS